MEFFVKKLSNTYTYDNVFSFIEKEKKQQNFEDNMMNS